ncbi:hypothetical protein [Devosia ginsengisoli]|uniref:Uncharacterized protein n=1 Tax=Devosia ginsengisoli TaxID=400770 RepID=A0A5B8LTI3_9HYPH|nr:hypothetical protein [Devosia ginsengisoli]QDZ11577.1 hypothetical protein FPZ08_12890 [Devosia ginsengisoli]
MIRFDYAAAAELFPSKSPYKSAQVSYRRFATAAEAVRYAIEDMPAPLLRGSLLEVDEQRFDGTQIRSLYDADAFPLVRAERT